MHLRLSRFVGLAPERADEMVIAFEEGDYLDRLAEAPGSTAICWRQIAGEARSPR